MALESATYISDLVATNPVHATDDVSQGDDHLRLIKAALLATFPNIDAAMNATEDDLNLLAGAAAAATLDIDLATVDLDGTTFAANYTTLTLTGGSAVLTLSGTEVDLTATTLDFNGNANISGSLVCGATTLGGYIVNVQSAASPRLGLYDTTGATDEKGWVIWNLADGVLEFVASSDANYPSSGSAAMRFLRTGANVDEAEINADLIDLNTNTFSLGSAMTLGIAMTAGGIVLTPNGDTTATFLWHEANDRWQFDDVLYVGGNLIADGGTTTISGSLDVDGTAVFTGGVNAAPVARSITDTGNTATTDRGIVVRMTSGSSKTFTLDGDPPTNAVVILDNSSGSTWTIAASGTLIWALTAGTGNRTLADDGLAVAVHRGSGVWVISGGGLT